MIASRSSLGGGFPGLAVFSLLALTVVLGLVALAGLKPWQPDSVDPHLSPLGHELAVGDAVALPSPPVALVAEATVAPGPSVLVGEAVARSGNGDGADVVLAVAPGRPVAAVEAGAAPAPAPAPVPVAPGPEAQPVASPAPSVPPVPAATPVTVGEGPNKPVPSGAAPEVSCEGDEYVLTITPIEGEEPISEESPVEILLQRFDEDGVVDELRAESDLLDAYALVAQLSSEGNCVTVEIVSPAEGEDGEEVAEVDEDVPATEPPGPASP